MNQNQLKTTFTPRRSSSTQQRKPFLCQDLSIQAQAQIIGGDGRFPKLDDDLKEIDWDKLLAKAKEAEKQINQSPLFVDIIID